MINNSPVPKQNCIDKQTLMAKAVEAAGAAAAHRASMGPRRGST